MSLFDETDFLSLSRDLRHSLGKQKTKQTGVKVGEDKLKAYRAERVEVLRRLYEENPVQEEKILIYENPYSPFDDLELLEEKMPNREDFI